MESEPSRRGGAAPVALVTGGAIRVGGAITRALVAAGYRVWIHCNRSTEAAARLAEELGDRADGGVLGVLSADLTDPRARERLLARVGERAGSAPAPAGGRLDLLVNSAASFEHGKLLERGDDDLLRVLTLNLVAPIALIRGLAPALAAAGGAVVNILDLAARQPWRGYLDHCTAKAGLEMATKVLALELAPAIRVNGIAPGTVLWPEGAEFAPGSPRRAQIVAGIPLGRVGTPEDIARAVVYLAGEPFITGHTLVVDGGRASARGAGP